MKNPQSKRRHSTFGSAFIFAAISFQLSTFGQGSAFTYQGRVQDNGTNFTGMGLFKFVLVTSTNTGRQATALAHLNNDFVMGYNVTDGGSGYTITPIVTVSGGGGSGATATAIVGGDAVVGINPNAPGSGYTSTPTVTIAAPPNNPTYTTYWSNDGTNVSD